MFIQAEAAAVGKEVEESAEKAGSAHFEYGNS